MNFKYELTAHTDIGEKETNQDRAYISKRIINEEECIFALVCDGMGGTFGGEIAAEIVRDEFAEWFKTLPDKEITEEILKEWDRRINDCRVCINSMTKIGEIPGTTLSMIFLSNGMYYAANIGDSRIYHLKDQLYQVTIDHSWAYQAREQGVSAYKIERDPRKNAITRCIGAGVDTSIADYFTGTYGKDDYFLLCSDGFRHLISTAEIMKMLRSNLDIQDKARTLIEKNKERGETDNITCLMIQVE